MPCEHEYKCAPLKDLEKRVDGHEDRIRPIETDSAVIKTKLNAILWAVSITAGAVITTIVGIVIKIII